MSSVYVRREFGPLWISEYPRGTRIRISDCGWIDSDLISWVHPSISYMCIRVCSEANARARARKKEREREAERETWYFVTTNILRYFFKCRCNNTAMRDVVNLRNYETALSISRSSLIANFFLSVQRRDTKKKGFAVWTKRGSNWQPRFWLFLSSSVIYHRPRLAVGSLLPSPRPFPPSPEYADLSNRTRARMSRWFQ